MILKSTLKCITNNFKPPKNFGLRKTEKSFRFIWFEEFTWFFYSVDGRMEPIICLLFYLVIKMLQQERTKGVKYYYIDF